MKRARILAATKRRSLVGPHWLETQKYQLTPANQIAASECFSMSSKKLMNATNSSEVHTIERSEMESTFPNSYKRHGRIKDHLIKLEFIDDVKFTQQKGRRVPIKLQEVVQNEIARPMKEKYNKKMSTVNDNVSIQPTVITVKKDKSVKISLDARELIKLLGMKKYPMPNMEHLIDLVAKQLDKPESETWFTSLDMQQAYGQITLDRNV